jgi:hypothetical protein
MKGQLQRVWWPVWAIVLASVAASWAAAFAQDARQPAALPAYEVVVPLRGTNMERVRSAIDNTGNAGTAPSTAVPMWNYSLTSPLDGIAYSGSMVGASPFFNGSRTTSIATVIVPLIVNLPDGSSFDPTVVDSCSPVAPPLAQVQGSPLFVPSSYVMNSIPIGSTQYIDAFQRANFYNTNISRTGNSYHTVFGPVTTVAAQTMTIPAGEGASWNLGGCGNLGVVDFSTFYSLLENTVLPSLAGKIGPTVFAIFIVHDVVMGDPGTSPNQNCCIIGFHGALGFPVQTYAVADYDSTGHFSRVPDIAALSHEVGGWMDDPLGSNATPAWGNVGQVSGCQSNLEVGDPLTGSLFAQTGDEGLTCPTASPITCRNLLSFRGSSARFPPMLRAANILIMGALARYSHYAIESDQ